MKYNNSLSDGQIKQIIDNYNLNDCFGGVYCKDNLPSLKKGYFYIINLDDKKGDGTHWTAFYYNSPLYSIYHDSFGFPSPEIVQHKIKPYTFSDVDIQDYDSTACGYYCIEFIKFLHNKKDKYKAFNTYIKLYSKDTNKNDIILNRLL